MSVVEIRSHNIWFKHIRGNDQLVAKLTALREGEIIVLIVGGFTGDWEKMRNGTSGSLPTAGIKPIGKAKKHWHALQSKRGKTVEIRESGKQAKMAPQSKRTQKSPAATWNASTVRSKERKTKIIIDCALCGVRRPVSAPIGSRWVNCPGCGFLRAGLPKDG